jgi:serine/threonine protein kinase
MSSANKKDSFSFVPQEISRHFIEPSSIQEEDKQHTNVGICIKETAFDITIDDEDEYEEEEEEKVLEDNLVIYHARSTQKEEEDDSATLYESDCSETEEEEEEEEEECQPPKWSFVRGLFSKLHMGGNSPQPPQYSTATDGTQASLSLSTYGVLQNKRIGEGVSATVQLIQRVDETFAVKIFRKKKRRESLAGYMKALAGEFCISSALNHPNIIKTLDFVRMDEDHARYCIVMEYVSLITTLFIITLLNHTF